MTNLLAGNPTVTYCEKAAAGIIKRPWYLISNLAFLISGIMIMKKGGFDRLSKLFGFLAIAVGIFSGIYDATFTRTAQLADLSMMIIFVTVLIYLTMSDLYKLPKKPFIKMLAGIIGISIALMIMFGGVSGDIIFGVYVIALIGLEGIARHKEVHANYKPFGIAVALLTLGFGFWFLDISRIYCISFGMLNGRAIFHYLTAISIYYVYSFYASQKQAHALK
jgi:hypothetical protein